jgi:phage gpG-like protein
MKSKESKSSSVTEIEFSAKSLLQSLRGHAEHLEGKRKLTMRVTRMMLPGPIKIFAQKKLSTFDRNYVV